MTDAAKPRYLQLKELIIRQISAGTLQPRDRVPSENELVDATGVSRMTANRALRELNDEGSVAVTTTRQLCWCRNRPPRVLARCAHCTSAKTARFFTSY